LLLKNNHKYKNKMSAKTASTKPASTASTKSTASTAEAPAKKAVEKKTADAPAKKVAEKKPATTDANTKPAKKAKTEKKESSATDSAVASALAASSSDGEKVRRVVNNEEIEKSFDELYNSLETELKSLREDKNHSVGIRYLRSLARQVKSLKADCFRLLSRKVRKPSARNGNSGFMKSVKISADMAKFCNFKADQLVSRVDVTKAICNYVKEKNLQNPADRRQFTPDEKLATLLGVKEVITYYTLQKHIQKHFPKA
jgi:upstream activation factor subunit UAF30